MEYTFFFSFENYIEYNFRLFETSIYNIDSEYIEFNFEYFNEKERWGEKKFLMRKKEK